MRFRGLDLNSGSSSKIAASNEGRIEMSTDVPIACTLSGGDRGARTTAMRELGGRALVGVDAGDRRARLRFHGEPERIEALVAAERQCCGFFQFTMTRDGEETELEIRTPEGGEPILRALVAAIVAGWGGELG
jgi:MerR family copper efflux transcriptional regulator